MACWDFSDYAGAGERNVGAYDIFEWTIGLRGGAVRYFGGSASDYVPDPIFLFDAIAMKKILTFSCFFFKW